MVVGNNGEIDPSMFERTPMPAEALSGGARVVGEFSDEELSRLGNAAFSVHAGMDVTESGAVEVLLPIIDEAIRRFPFQRIDVSVTREPFTKGKSDSFSTFRLGIHIDGFENGFFVHSTDEPTVFYDDIHGTNPKQAKPGQLVYVPSACYHSSPTPDHDGERVRIKLIPQNANSAY